MGEGVGKPLRGRIQSVLLDHVEKRQIDVDVVVQAWRLLERFLQQTVVPRDRGVVVDHRAAIAKLGRTSEGDPDRLPRPAALDLVAKGLGGEPQGAITTGGLGRDRGWGQQSNACSENEV